MSHRSKREPKPTKKFLHFCAENKNEPDNGNVVKDSVDTLNKADHRSHTMSMFSKGDSKREFKGFSKVKIQAAKHKQSLNKFDKDTSNSNIKTGRASVEIRRSSREPKANTKLKEFLHSGPNLKENFFAGFDTGDDLTTSPSRSLKLKETQEKLELVNETCENQPLNDVKLVTRSGTSFSAKGAKIVKPVQKPLVSVQENKKSTLKRRLHTDSNEKETKFPKLNTLSLPEKHVTSTHLDLDEAKGYNESMSTSSNVLGESIHDSSNSNPQIISERINPKVTLMNREIPGILYNKSNCDKPSYNEMESQLSSSKNTIRDSLKKFLVMGTKVANVISETLKHNEEELLSSSSAFEKKCLSIVHVLASSGKDLQEGDMEKILTLLDEEQEERKSYRQAFLESLRVSHLTNMALYSQMLRLLKTL